MGSYGLRTTFSSWCIRRAPTMPLFLHLRAMQIISSALNVLFARLQICTFRISPSLETSSPRSPPCARCIIVSRSTNARPRYRPCASYMRPRSEVAYHRATRGLLRGDRAAVQAQCDKISELSVGEDERCGGRYDRVLDRIRTVVRCEALAEKDYGERSCRWIGCF